MQIPHTPVLCAPSQADPFGVTMLSADIIKGLERLNSKARIPTPSSTPYDYPGKAFGHTCIWIGPPGEPDSKKMCAFHLGAVPEWTQKDAKGRIIVRGWRSIFEKCIKLGFCSRLRLEREFRISMNVAQGKPEAKLCWRCMQESKFVRSNGGTLGMCDFHQNVRIQSRAAQDRRREQTYQQRVGVLDEKGNRFEPVKKEGKVYDRHISG